VEGKLKKREGEMKLECAGVTSRASVRRKALFVFISFNTELVSNQKRKLLTERRTKVKEMNLI
jgi:hypothetical protein